MVHRCCDHHDHDLVGNLMQINSSAGLRVEAMHPASRAPG